MGGRRWLVPGAIVAAVAIVAVAVTLVVVGGDDEAAAATTLLEPATDPGPDAFMTSVTVIEVSSLPDAVVAVATDTRDRGTPDDTTGTTTLTGTTPGLYGGTRDDTVCDVEAMTAFLDANPSHAEAWADVADIGVDDLADHLGSLEPVALTTDTWVTNHGYAGGTATPRQSILQAGTAVLVDDTGTPRARCSCGNPLRPPDPDVDPTTTTGTPWATYDPTAVTTIAPGTPADTLTLVDIETGDTYQKSLGDGAVPSTADDLLDAEVPWSFCGVDELATLVEGSAEEPDDLGGRRSMSVEDVQIADLTGDGVDDALVTVVEVCGAASVITVVHLHSDGEVLATIPVLGGFGTGSDHVAATALDDGTVELEVFEERECRACPPTGVSSAQRFRWDGTDFVAA